MLAFHVLYFAGNISFWKCLCTAISIKVVTGLSLRAGGRGFSLAIKRMVPGYFYWKIEEKYNQKKSLAIWFPAYLLYLPGNLKS